MRLGLLFVALFLVILVSMVAIVTSKNRPRILDLAGQPVGEPRPVWTPLALEGQCIVPNRFLTWFTTDVCRKRGESTAVEDRIQFAKAYGVRWEEALACRDAATLEECVGNFGTLNDFFTRQIHPELTAPGEEDIASPAECRCRIVHLENPLGVFAIKGANYTVRELLGAQGHAWIPTVAAVAIFRLAPTDYHRVHAPVGGQVVGSEDLGGGFRSVDPLVLCQRPVLQENVRRVFRIADDQGRRLALVLVGATCVGSIRTSVAVGDRIQKGQDLGDFTFGGSCVVLISAAPIRWHPQLLLHTQQDTETFLRAGTGVGLFAT